MHAPLLLAYSKIIFLKPRPKLYVKKGFKDFFLPSMSTSASPASFSSPVSSSTSPSISSSSSSPSSSFLTFQTLRCCIYPANKCSNANNCWHFNIYEQDKFNAQLSWEWKSFITWVPVFPNINVYISFQIIIFITCIIINIIIITIISCFSNSQMLYLSC